MNIDKLFIEFLLFPVFLINTILTKDDELNDLVKSSRNLTKIMYKNMNRKQPDNLVFSPFSLQIILAVLSEGTKGETRSQLVTGLFLPTKEENFKNVFKTFSTRLHDNDNYFMLGNANKLYAGEKTRVIPNFTQLAREYYECDIENINLQDKTKSAGSINAWVEKHTFTKIKNLLEPEDIDVGFVLVNAIYLNATWLHRFHARGHFYFCNGDENRVMVPFMTDNNVYPYYRNSNLKADFLEIPYKDNKENGLSMIIVLPNKVNGLADIEQHLDEVFKSQPFKPTSIHIEMPKFTVKSKIDFRYILRSLGITQIFDSSMADFSNLVEHGAGLKVSNVIQKAFINVQKDGTEAAAATSSIIMRSARFPVETTNRFIVDHPFIYYIQREGLIIFAGRLASL